MKLFLEHAKKTHRAAEVLDEAMVVVLRRDIVEPLLGNADFDYVKSHWMDRLFDATLEDMQQILVSGPVSDELRNSCSVAKILVESDLVPRGADSISGLQTVSKRLYAHAFKRLGITTGLITGALVLYYMLSKIDATPGEAARVLCAFLFIYLLERTVGTAQVFYDACTLSQTVQQLIQRRGGSVQPAYGAFEV